MMIPHRFRRGYSLIELITVLTVLVILLSLCAGMIHSLMKLDRAGREALDEAADMARLSTDFRADFHAANQQDVVLSAPDHLIWNGAENRTVEYVVRRNDILRSVRLGSKIRHSETYRKPVKVSIRFERNNQGASHFIRVYLDREVANANGSLYQDFRIDAELGRNLRLTLGAH